MMKLLPIVLLLATVPSAERLRVEGTYENSDYAYSVRLPAGTYGLGHQSGTPNHGFQLLGPALQRGTLWVDASYNSTFLPNVAAVAKEHFAPVPLVSTSGRNVALHTLVVGGLPALRVTLTDLHAKAVEDAVFVLRPYQGEVGIIYTVILTVPQSEYEGSRRYLEELVHTINFKEHPAA